MAPVLERGKLELSQGHRTFDTSMITATYQSEYVPYLKLQ